MVDVDREERKEGEWQLEHDLWDFLNWIASDQKIELARWQHTFESRAAATRHAMNDHVFCKDELVPIYDLNERRNLSRKFLELESWEESLKKADDLLKRIRERSKDAT